MLCLLYQAAAEHAVGAATTAAATSLPDAAQAADEGLLLHMLPYIVMGVSYIVCMQFLKSPESGTLPCKFLGDIAYWTVPPSKQADGSSSSSSTAAVAAAAATSLALSQASPGGGGGKKKVRKLQAQQQQMAAASAQGLGLLQAGYLEPRLMGHLEFTDEVEYMLRLAAFIVTLMVSALLIRVFVTPKFPGQPINMLFTSWGFLFWVLYKVEWSHMIIGRDEKMYMAGAAFMGLIVCFSLLVLAPAHLMAFDMGAALEEAMSRVRALVASKYKSLPVEQLTPVADARPLGTVLAVLGGVLAGLLMAPGIRYGRLLQSFLEPPTWALNLKPKAGPKLLAQTAFALQLLLSGLWVTSLTDVLRLGGSSDGPFGAAAGGGGGAGGGVGGGCLLAYLRGGLMLLVAVLQALTAPYLLQAFLYSTPLHAHIVTKTPGVTDDMKTKSVKKVTQITLSQASKVCVQLLVVPLLLLTSSLGYLLLSFGSPLEVTSPFARVWDKQPSVFLMSVAGFMGWWGSTVYMFWASLGCILSRLNSSALAG